jgi:cytochrome b561
MTQLSSTGPVGYRPIQIALHWLVFLLVAFLFFTGDNMTDAFQAMHRNGASAWSSIWVPIHITAGLIVLSAMIWRLALRQRYGAPPPAADEAQPLRLLATGVHSLLYLDLIVAPLVGLAAFFLAPRLGGAHHFLVRLPLIALVGLHVVGGLWHLIGLRDKIFQRMLRPV